MKKVIALVGPTGTGKTSLSISIAKHFNTKVINGDSVQIYKRLNIGSAKITDVEKMGIKHYLLDFVDPKNQFSVYDFQVEARKIIDEEKIPFIVGGTGLYIKSVLYDYKFTNITHNLEFEQKYDNISNEDLYQKLLKVNPLIIIDKNNRRRVLRALEQSLSGNVQNEKTDKKLYDSLVIYLDIDRKELKKRIKMRLKNQIELGFIDEVKELKSDGIVVNAIGYREMDEYLSGNYDLDTACEKIINASMKLAKRQKTWFLNQMDSIVFDSLSKTLLEDVISKINSFLKE